MKAKTTIDERISKLKSQNQKIELRVAKIDAAWDKCQNLMIKKNKQIERLEATKARKQKDAAIGDKLVESGVITEEDRKAIESLPEPADITQEVN